MRALGMMSGTSLDGIDCALVDVTPTPSGYAFSLERFATRPFPPDLRERLLAALPPNEPCARAIVDLDDAVGDALARAALDVLGDDRVDFVASHGLTLYHEGERARTFQIGAPYRLRDAVRASVVYDFRRADCALGGHGAPLVPHFDALAFGSDDRDVVALNLGGIANVSIVPRGTGAVAAAWDTGPANVVIDTFVAARTAGEHAYDRDGEFARRGRVDDAALRALFASEASYFEAPAPKSTGRERFGPHFLAHHASTLASLSLEDGCATLAALTARSIVRSLERDGPATATLVASGGGVHNAAIVAELRDALEARGWRVERSDAFGIDADAKEAIAFATFAYETLRDRPSSVPSATGARAPAVLGSIAPYRLAALVDAIRATERPG